MAQVKNKVKVKAKDKANAKVKKCLNAIKEIENFVLDKSNPIQHRADVMKAYKELFDRDVDKIVESERMTLEIREALTGK